MKLAEKVSSFPTKPGVYLFKNAKGEILYIGKARVLRKRVASYFRAGVRGYLLRKATNIDFIVTDSEKEALLLENTLIKKHHPRYNIQLRDDKTYVSIRVGLNHRFPGIFVVRRVFKDGASYFGPFASAAAARETVDQAVSSFRIRTCSDREFANRIRPCLEFDLKRCGAPCVGKISEVDYKECVGEASLFLKGESRGLIKRLKEKMQDASSKTRYEEAARIRNVIAKIEDTLSKQKVVTHGGGDRDIIGLAREADRIAICILMVRGGVLLDRRMHATESIRVDDARILETFMIEHYSQGREIPNQIAVSHHIEGVVGLVLRERHGGKIRIFVPKRGAQFELVKLAMKNAVETIKARRGGDVLIKLKKKLRLDNTPEIIECIDISNLMGREAYGSKVTFVHGEPQKSRYRLYTIRTLTTPDDYGMMREVLTRRFEGPVEPDLLLVDGGKGQLNIAVKVLNELGLESIPVAAIAKEKGKNPLSHDKIFLPGRKNPVSFKRGSPEILLLERIRDEAHRFGITAHRKKHTRMAFVKNQ